MASFSAEGTIMKVVYTGTYEIQTKLFRTQRSFQFKSLEARIEFEVMAAGLGVVRVASNIEHTLSAREAFTELENEVIRCNEIAEGRTLRA
jgi:hypothetical protein